MNKQLLLVLSTACMLIVASCKKSIETIDPEKKCHVRLVEHIYTERSITITDKYYYSYDNQGRVVRLDYGSEQSSDFESFTYNGNKVTWKGVEGDIEIYTLDASGRIINAEQGRDLLNFKYNMDGQMFEASIDGNKQTLTYLNGNLSATAYNATPWMKITYGNTVSGNHVVTSWVFGEVLDFDEIGYRITPYVGKISTHLPSKLIYEPGASQTVVDIVYTNDDKGNVTSAKMTDSGGQMSEYRFSYECK